MKPNLSSFALVSLVTLCGPGIAGAQQDRPHADLPPTEGTRAAAESNDWDFTTYGYGWLTRMDGKVGVGAKTVPADASFSDSIDALEYLKGALMFGLEAHHAPYSIFGDLFYVDLEADGHTSSGKVTTEIEQIIAEAGGAYTLPIDAPSLRLDLLGGGRLEGFELKIDADTDDMHVSKDRSWVDPFVGARAIVTVSPSVNMWTRGDVGGFGVGSDLTWNAQVGMDWRFAEAWSLGVAYRIFDVDYNHDGFIYDVRTDGPEIGVGHRF